jgi:hypothetical protein
MSKDKWQAVASNLSAVSSEWKACESEFANGTCVWWKDFSKCRFMKERKVVGVSFPSEQLLRRGRSDGVVKCKMSRTPDRVGTSSAS